MSGSPEVLFARSGGVGHIHLNRPKALNAVTASMCIDIRKHLEDWAEDASVRLVVVTGEGERAFCAGGDVRQVYETAKTDPVEARGFFAAEYAMDAMVSDYPKPYLSLIDGIVMGGGLGISVNGQYRVVSEHVMAAMPETGIGLLPDVGATAFLNACPGRLGLFLGLTGTRLDAADTLYAGFATHVVPRDHQQELLAQLAGLKDPCSVPAEIARLLNTAAIDPGPSKLAARQEEIDRLFKADRPEEIIAALDREETPFASSTAQDLRSMSPTSLRITARQITENRHITAKDALVLEYRMVSHVLERPDFFEGIRAALVDKDRNPRWDPASLDRIDEADIDAHFASLGDAELVL